MDMNPWLILLVFAGLLLVAFGIGVLHRRTHNYKSYDERQRIARGKAYQAAFWILAIYSLMNALLDVSNIQWADTTTGTFLGILLAIAVFAMINIINDSFYSFKERPGSYFAIFLIAIALNLLITISNFVEGTSFVTNGMLNYHCISFFIVVMFMPPFITLAVKYWNDKKHVETE